METLKKVLKENSDFTEANIFKTLLAFANKSGTTLSEDPNQK